ncbi:MAG: methyltransferase domain-containing protein [Tistlia sp.]|uniref:methyltransferase domain-containing protein n=1 Tax=Tistlia sp. TaxID=3057121 RepID=UPI0034A1D3C3
MEQETAVLAPSAQAVAGPRATEFCCPRCEGRPPLDRVDQALVCASCGTPYPIVRGIPVLINDDNSVFAVSDYESSEVYRGDGYGTSTDSASKLRSAYHRFAGFFLNFAIKRRHLDAEKALESITAELPDARILVIGAGDAIYEGEVDYVYTDVAFSRNAVCICDAHDLPFADAHFDAVVAVAVMEHVIDPPRCVAEIHRVLKPRGYVYAATPFMQPVHMGAYDFTRYSYLGHRRLFRWFDDIESGVALGPGAAASYALQYLPLCFSDNGTYRRIVRLLALIAATPLKLLDHFTFNKKASYDMAGGVFFFGRRRSAPISDREMIRNYRGAIRKGA